MNPTDVFIRITSGAIHLAAWACLALLAWAIARIIYRAWLK